MSQTVLILGGGVGGLAAANRLRRRLPREHRVVLVDREASFSLAASFLWVMTGDRAPAQVSRPLEGLRRRGIDVVLGEVERIDPERREAVVGGKTLAGDHLIVALGAEFAPDAVDGLAGSGLTFCTLDGATRLREALDAFDHGRIVVMTAAPAYKCPAAPYEAAMLIEDGLRRRGVRDRVTLELYTAEPGPMGVAGPEVSAAVRGLVESKGIPYFPAHQVARVDPAGRRVVFTNGVEAPFDLLVHVPPVRAQRVVRECGIAGAGGWAEVDRNTLQTRFPGVHAVGDATAIPLAMGKPLPKAGVFAHAQAEVVAANIVRAVTGRGGEARYEGQGGCFIESGAGAAGYGSGNFYAEPLPAVRMHRPGRLWHAGKVLFEKYWFYRQL